MSQTMDDYFAAKHHNKPFQFEASELQEEQDRLGKHVTWYFVKCTKCCGCYPMLKHTRHNLRPLEYLECLICHRTTKPVDDTGWEKSKELWEEAMKK